MQPFRSSSAEINVPTVPIEGVKSEVLVSLATVPCLGILILGRTAIHWIHQLGVASEEVFRGERLPVITPPERDFDSTTT